MNKYFINLTNGIEFFCDIEYLKNKENFDYSYIRLQSTTLEQKHIEDFINQLDNNLLMNLALGNNCIIIDYGSRNSNGISRVCWQGVPIIIMCLELAWFGEIKSKIMVKNCNCTNHYINFYKLFSEKTKNKLKYFRKFLKINDVKTINLSYYSKLTENDGNNDFYCEILKNKNE